MPLDQTANFVNVEITGTYTDTDTVISLEGGGASELPDPVNGEYNLVWYDANNYNVPDADPEVEIVRVTSTDTGNDTVTVSRGQENTSAVAHDTSGAEYRFILAFTSKMIADIESRNVEGLSTQGASGTVPVSQGDGSLAMQEVGGSSVSNNGTEVESSPDDINFGQGVEASSDGDGSASVVQNVIEGGAKVFVQDTQPSATQVGDVWIATGGDL